MLDLRIETKAYGGGKAVLSRIAFSLASGERVALLGPSGAGKSTLLRIVLGLERNFTGEVRCRAARIGVMFQEPRLLPWLTVGDNLRLVGRADLATPDVSDLLMRVALNGAADLFPRQLSLGMARRVALARALAVRPDLLVLDEPFASLDPASSALMTDVARRTEATMLVATHDLAHALEFATRILVLDGSPSTLALDRQIAPDGHAVPGLVEELRAAFPFLARGEATSEVSAALPATIGLPRIDVNEDGRIE